MTHFHNPYNFVPVGQPDKIGRIKRHPNGTITDPLGQGGPVGHHRYHPGHWSGRIEIEIEVVTPMLISDATNVETVNKHKTFDVRLGPDSRPLLPVTTLKGALRSAYEAITNSRFGVFGREHETKVEEKLDTKPNTRKVATCAPIDLLPMELRPSSSLESLSPADRVFGWVSQQGRGAWRGQLRIHHIECLRTDGLGVQSFQPTVALEILGQPKIQQARFYVGDKNGGPQENGISRKDAAYHKSKRLRGRKFYPHHAKLESVNYERAMQERSDQNRSIRSWIVPGTKFCAVIDVVNLNDAELGALLWLLDLSSIGSGDQRCFHRIGGGKPLGFGSVTIVVRNIDLATGEMRKAGYCDLSGKPQIAPELSRYVARDWPRCRHTLIVPFTTALSAAYGDVFEKIGFVAAFLVATRGFSDRLPIHYPRLNEVSSARNENFKWFNRNEYNRDKRREGQKLNLGPLEGDPGLPYEPG